MIWYRHWLEIRWRLPMLALVAGLMGGWPGTGMNGATSFEGTGRLFNQLLESRIAQSMGVEDLFVWAAFAERIATLAWVPALMLAGNGLHTHYMNDWRPRPVCLPFTLSLPVSRRRMIWTRYAVGWAAGVFAILLALGVQGALLAFEGHAVPWALMGISVAVVASFLTAVTAGAGTLLIVTDSVFFHLLAVLAVLISVPLIWFAAITLPARGGLPWVAIAAPLAVAVLLSIWSAVGARRLEG